jgi:hypothetical protein
LEVFRNGPWRLRPAPDGGTIGGKGLRASLVCLIISGLASSSARKARPATPELPSWAGTAYTLVMAALLVAYGVRLGHRLSLGVAGQLLACWLAGAAWWGYRALRQIVAGLDYVLPSLTLFALAVLVSLAKAGALSRRTGRPTDP